MSDSTWTAKKVHQAIVDCDFRHYEEDTGEELCLRIYNDMQATIDAQAAQLATLERKEKGYLRELNEVEQTLGVALGYPWYCDDQENFPGATKASGVCIGEHTAASLAMTAAERLATLTAAKPVALDAPDGDGYWSFEGRLDGSSVEKLQWCVMVRRNSIDKNLYAWRFGGQTFKVSQMIGTWHKLYMPWDAATATADPDRGTVSAISVATIVDELERLCLALIDEINNENNIHTIVAHAALAWLEQRRPHAQQEID